MNNPAAIRAFSRARGWIGTISPPGVVAYLEEDARNVWEGGGAAFMRNWSYAYPLAEQSPEVRNRFSVAPMPVGANPQSSVLGGWYLGISRRTRHQAEAIAFVKYMVSQQVQRQRAIEGAFLPTLNSLYHDAAVLKADPFVASISSVANRIIRRPAYLLGAQYAPASQIYAHGVHLILTGQISSQDEAARMEAALMRLTGFAGRPSTPLGPPVGKKR